MKVKAVSCDCSYQTLLVSSGPKYRWTVYRKSIRVNITLLIDPFAEETFSFYHNGSSRGGGAVDGRPVSLYDLKFSSGVHLQLLSLEHVSNISFLGCLQEPWRGWGDKGGDCEEQVHRSFFWLCPYPVWHWCFCLDGDAQAERESCAQLATPNQVPTQPLVSAGNGE